MALGRCGVVSLPCATPASWMMLCPGERLPGMALVAFRLVVYPGVLWGGEPALRHSSDMDSALPCSSPLKDFGGLET